MLTKPPAGVMDDPFHPLSQGCVCHLLMNEGAGSLVYDVSGHGNHGTLKNMLPNVQGSGWGGSRFGVGLYFDSSNDHVEVPHDPSIKTENSFSYSLWFNAKVGCATGGLISKAQICGSKSYDSFSLYVRSSNPYLRAIVSDGDGAHIQYTEYTTDIRDGTWHHAVVVWNEKVHTQYLYVDGIIRDYDQNNNISDINNTQSVLIGKNIFTGPENLFFQGSIDDVRFYNRILNVEEIKQLYYDPFCNLLQVPIWQLYSPVVGLSIPVAMHHYEMLRA